MTTSPIDKCSTGPDTHHWRTEALEPVRYASATIIGRHARALLTTGEDGTTRIWLSHKDDD